MLTNKQIESIGFNRTFKKTVIEKWIREENIRIGIDNSTTLSDVIDILYLEAYNKGIEEGKRRRSRDIRVILEID